MCCHFCVLTCWFHLTSLGRVKCCHHRRRSISWRENVIYGFSMTWDNVGLQNSKPLTFVFSLLNPSLFYFFTFVWSEGNLSVHFRTVFQNFSDDVLLVYIIETKCGMEQEIGLPKEEVGRIGCARIRQLLSWTKMQSFCWSRKQMVLHIWMLASI